MSAASAPSSAASPLSLIRYYPRAVVYQLVLLPVAMGVGGIVYAKLLLATQYLQGAAGLGKMGLLFSLSCAIAAFLGGALADRFSARWLNGLALVTCGGAIACTGWLLPQLAPADVYWATLGMVCLEGAATGIAMACNPVVLATVVGHRHRGAVDLINNLRVGLGMLMGMQLAQYAPSLPFNMIASGTSVAIGGLLSIAVIPAMAAVAAPRGWGFDLKPVLQSLQQLPSLRNAVGTDLLLKLAIPTQMGALYLADRQVHEQAGVIFSAGLLGVLLANLWLTVVPPPVRLTASLRRYFALYLTLAFVAPWLLIDNWLVGLPWLAGALLFFGSFVSTATESQVRAFTQQETPDSVRGRINGILGAVRNGLSAVFGALHAAIAHVNDVQWLLGGLFLASVLVWLLTRGFSAFDRSPSPAA